MEIKICDEKRITESIILQKVLRKVVKYAMLFARVRHNTFEKSVVMNYIIKTYVGHDFFLVEKSRRA